MQQSNESPPVKEPIGAEHLKELDALVRRQLPPQELRKAMLELHRKHRSKPPQP